MPTSWKDFGRSGARNTHVTADLLDVGKGKGGVMNQTYWFEGLFGQTPCRIGVTRKSDTWIYYHCAGCLHAWNVASPKPRR